MTKEEATARADRQWLKDRANGRISTALLLPAETLVAEYTAQNFSASALDKRVGTGHTLAEIRRKGYTAKLAHFQRVLRFLGYVIVKPDKAYLANLAADLGYTIKKKHYE